MYNDILESVGLEILTHVGVNRVEIFHQKPEEITEVFKKTVVLSMEEKFLEKALQDRKVPENTNKEDEWWWNIDSKK